MYPTIMACPGGERLIKDFHRVFDPIFAWDGRNYPLDPIFISIDLDFSNGDHRPPTDVGMTTLDSRGLVRLLHTNEKPLMFTRHYTFRPEADRRVQGKFCFGNIQRIPLSLGFKEALTQIFEYRLSASTNIMFDSKVDLRPPYNTGFSHRPIVLVGHDIEHDLRSLRAVGFNIGAIGPVMAVLDTCSIVRARSGKSFRLRKLCKEHLEIDGRYFRVSGNDAVYSMLALLSLAAEISDYASYIQRVCIRDFVSSKLERTRPKGKKRQKSVDQSPDWLDFFATADSLLIKQEIDDTDETSESPVLAGVQPQKAYFPILCV